MELEAVARELLQKGRECECDALQQEVARLTNLRDQIDVDYVLREGKVVHTLPKRLLDGKYDYYKESNIIVALDDDNENGYYWDLVVKQNRLRDCARVRNGMNSSEFEDCVFYWICTAGSPQPTQLIGFPATNERFYRMVKRKIDAAMQKVECENGVVV